MKTIHVIINPASGQPQPVIHTLNHIFGEAGVEWDVSVTKAGDDATRFARSAAERGVDVVAAYGGDGTQMEVAQGLRGTNTPMAVLPGGTANLLSVELNIPSDLEQAIRLILSEDHVLRPVDMGHAVLRDGEASYDFILRIGIGFEGLKIQIANRAMKNKFGELAYTIAGLDALKEVTPSDYHLELDGKPLDISGVNLLVTNAGNFGVPGYSRSTKISVSDGLLDVLVVKEKTLSTLTTIARETLSKNPDQNRPLWQAKHIRIEAEPAQPVNGDGEWWGPTPIDIEVIPAAVKIIAPPPAAA